MCRRVNHVDATSDPDHIAGQSPLSALLTRCWRRQHRVDLWHAPQEHPRRMAPASSMRREHAQIVGTQRRWREWDSAPPNRIFASEAWLQWRWRESNLSEPSGSVGNRWFAAQSLGWRG